jgi:hypothetical protein
MPQVQMKQTYISMTISCDHCLQEQIVHMQARTGYWQMAHQSASRKSASATSPESVYSQRCSAT